MKGTLSKSKIKISHVSSAGQLRTLSRLVDLDSSNMAAVALAAAMASRDYEYGFSTKRAHTHTSMVERYDIRLWKRRSRVRFPASSASSASCASWLLALLSVRLGEAGGASGWFFLRRHRQRRDDRRLRHLHAPRRTRGRGTHALMLILGRRPDGHDHPARARLRLRVMNEHMGGPSAPEHGGIDFGIGSGMSNNARHERGQTLWHEDVGCGSSPPTSC